MQLKTRLKDLIEESLNSTVPVISTTVDSHEDFAVYHSTLDTQPELYVDIRLINFNHEKTIADVVFYPAGRNFKALNVFGTKGGLSIFNTVIKLCESHLDDVDVWFFSAKFTEHDSAKQFEKRTDLYSRLSERMCRKHALNLRSFNLNNDKIWVASKEVVDDAKVKAFVDHCASLSR